jgi:hypothetical protein
VTWPKVAEVDRRDGNGVSFYGGVATIDGSDQYGLSLLAFDPFQSRVRATYIDAWALNAPNAASCSVTFRAVERALTQDQANALNPELATAEFETIKRDHPDLVRSGERTREGSGDTRVVDRFSWGGADGVGPRFDGLSKSWVFVRFGKAYYVQQDLPVADRHRRPDGHGPADRPELPHRRRPPIPCPPIRFPRTPPRQLIYLPPPVGQHRRPRSGPSGAGVPDPGVPQQRDTRRRTRRPHTGRRATGHARTGGSRTHTGGGRTGSGVRSGPDRPGLCRGSDTALSVACSDPGPERGPRSDGRSLNGGPPVS